MGHGWQLKEEEKERDQFYLTIAIVALGIGVIYFIFSYWVQILMVLGGLLLALLIWYLYWKHFIDKQGPKQAANKLAIKKNKKNRSTTIIKDPSPEIGAEVIQQSETKRFHIFLVEIGNNKIELIKELRNILPELDLADAKKLVEKAPCLIKKCETLEESSSLKKNLVACGAKIEVKVDI